MKFEGTQVNIPIKGIMRAGTDNVCADGAMQEVIGMEYKDGSWLPYKENETTYTVLYNGAAVANIVNVYVHKTTDSDSHLLFLQPDGKLYYQVGNTSATNVVNVDLLAEGVRDVSFVGNMVCVATNTGLEHYIWQEQDYIKKERTYPIVEIKTGIGFIDRYNEKVSGILYKNVQGDRTVSIPDTSDKEVIMGDLIAVQGKVRDAGGLTGYCLAVIAYRLKNSEIVCPNPPVLLGRTNAKHGSDIDGFREFSVENMSEYFDVPTASSSTVSQKLYSQFERGHVYPSPSLVDHDLYYIYTGDGIDLNNNESAGEATISLKYWEFLNPDDTPTGQIGTQPSLYARCVNGSAGRIAVPELHLSRIIYDDQSVSPERQRVQICDYAYAAGNGIQIKISGVAERAGEEIESVCIFLTPEISMFPELDNIERFNDIFSGEGYVTNHPNGGFGHRMFTYTPTRILEKDIIDKLSKLNTFYLAAEIPLVNADEYSSWKEISLYGVLGDNLVVREQLPATALNQEESTIPNHVSAYNYRLHAFDYIQDIFKGYQFQKFSHMGGLGQYDQEVSVIDTKKWEIKVELSDESGNSTVVNYSPEAVEEIVTSLSPILSYPSIYAKTMTIRLYFMENRYYYEKVYALKPINGLGIAAYIDPELKPIDIVSGLAIDGLPASIPVFTDINNVRSYANGLKVSDVAYPSFFPAQFTYRIGNEKIIGLARLTMPMSQDNFGNYSLIIFCTDGIYSLRVDTSGSGAYTSQAFVSPEVCVNENTICEIGGAVFFAGDKGLMMLTGDANGNVQLYAPHLNGEPRFLPAATASKEAHGVYKKMIDNTSILSKDDEGDFAYAISSGLLADFADFLKDVATRMVYISIKNKLLAFSESQEYAYLIDIPTGNTTKVMMSAFCDNGEVLDKEMWQIKDNAGKYTAHTFEYLSKTDNEIPSLIVTRPIKVQQDDKNSFRVVLTGYFEGESGNWADLLVLGSLDADHWRVIGVKEKKLVGGFHNLGCLTERGSWKYLMFIFGGKLSHESHIDSVDITVEGRYNNKKR